MIEMEKQKIGGYKSEFSMGELDFQRLHEILKMINYCSFYLGNGKYEYMKSLYSILTVFYDDIRPTFARSDEEKVKKIDKKIVEIGKKVDRADMSFHNLVNKKKMYYDPLANDIVSPNKLISEATKELMELKREILDIKQSIGLGLILEKMFTQKDLLAKGLGV